MRGTVEENERGGKMNREQTKKGRRGENKGRRDRRRKMDKG